jgi:hypothetical protein
LREHDATVNRNELIRQQKNGARGRIRIPDLLITNKPVAKGGNIQQQTITINTNGDYFCISGLFLIITNS